ncbi:hypothetical protein HanPI659440_Chr02g0035671 [Helianthus annuus]|nr:hypothetical protein HanPI659440_Chr02g0035671 [Helianthus annuus]
MGGRKMGGRKMATVERWGVERCQRSKDGGSKDGNGRKMGVERWWQRYNLNAERDFFRKSRRKTPPVVGGWAF